MKVDIAIVGAGLVGSTLALWLAKNTDYRVAVLERAEPMRQAEQTNQRVVALGYLATSLLDDVAVLTKLSAQHCHAYHRMHVWDESSDGVLEFDASLSGEPQLGHMIDSLQCTYELQQQILESTDIQSFFGSQITQLDLTGTQALIQTNEQEIQASLVIGADGARSWVRKQAKIFANHQSYGQRGIVAKIESVELHQHCAWQRFLSTGPIAILPLANNQSSIVWSADNETVNELLELDDTGFEAALEFALESRLGKIKLLDQRQAFPLISQKAQKYYTRNLALIGDAAHSIHPMAGQGANLGFKDVLCLGKILANAQSNELGSPRLLARYQNQRQPDNNQTDALMSFLHGSYKLDLPAWMAARGLGMNLINQSSHLRQFLTDQATGK